jgi:class 3 adenylate cyclase
MAVLPELTAEDLKDLGVSLVGHRRKLLGAISALRSGTTAAPDAAARPPTAERKQLTVMFCDLVSSTALSMRLDPEDMREVIAAYHGGVAEVVGGFDGFVAKYMGDGVLVYFGYPQHMRTMSNGQSGRGSALPKRSVVSMSNPSSFKRASESPPGWWSSAI